MAFYDDRLTRHTARAHLSEARDLATRANDFDWQDPDSKGPQYANAALAAVEDVTDRLELADPRLVTEEVLSEIERPALQVLNSLRSFSENPTVPEIQGAQHHAERLLAAARGLPPSPWQVEPDVVRNAGNRFRDRVAGLRREAERTIDQLKQEGEEAAAGLGSDLSGVESQLQQLQQQANIYEEATERRSEELKGGLARFQDRAEQIASGVEQTFNSMDERFGSAQDRRTERFEEAVSEQEQKFAASLLVWEGEWRERKAKLGEDSDELRRELGEQLAEAKRVLGFSAAASTYEANASEARRQEQTANRWRWIGIGLLIAAVAAAIALLVWRGPSDDMTLANMFVFFLPRLGVTSLIGAIAAYALRESGRHRARERLARQAAIDIQSFRPFLAELPEDERNEEIRLASRRQFFPAAGGAIDGSDLGGQS